MGAKKRETVAVAGDDERDPRGLQGLFRLTTGTLTCRMCKAKGVSDGMLFGTDDHGRYDVLCGVCSNKVIDAIGDAEAHE